MLNEFFGGATGPDGYQIEHSLRFNPADPTYLSRTFPSGGASSKWTYSAWVKRSSIGSVQTIFAGPPSQNYANLAFLSTNILEFASFSPRFEWQTTAEFRDTSAWMHIVLVFDSFSTDRILLYVNGVQMDFTGQAISLGADTAINTASAHQIGRYGYSSFTNYFDGYIADVRFFDNLTVSPTDLGEFDDNNVWQPKEYTGAAGGTNSFYLDFSDTSDAGADAAGSNDWTTFNVVSESFTFDTPVNSAEAGTGNFWTLDSVVKGATATITNGNLDYSILGGTTGTRYCQSNLPLPSSGKWYWEIDIATDNEASFGVIDRETDSRTRYYRLGGVYIDEVYTATGPTFTDGDLIGVAYDSDLGQISWYKNGSLVTSTSYALANSGRLFAYIENSTTSASASTGSINFGQSSFTQTPPTGFEALCTTNLPDPVILDGSTAMDVVTYTGNASTQTISGMSFGPDLLWYKARNGGFYPGLQDTVRGAGLSLSPADNNSEHTETHGLTGFTSDGFTLDSTGYYYINSNNEMVAWAWDAGDNSDKTYAVTVVSDGGNKYRFDGHGTSAVTLDLEEGSTYVFDQSDSSNAGHPLRFSTTSDGTHGSGTEYTTGVTTVGTPGSAGASTTIVLASGAPTLYYYCSVHSGMGGQANTNSTAGASNLDGSIQATVRANPSAGFSIVRYTGSSTGTSVGHGLNAAPEMIFVKDLDQGASWHVYHKGLNLNDSLQLNSNDSATNRDSWNNSRPTNQVFPLGAGISGVNTNNFDLIAYCWAPVEGYSAFGSYVGNGSAEGPIIHTGFQPRYFLVKSIDSATGYDWWILDIDRDPNNPVGTVIRANLTASESTITGGVQFLANGFQPMTNNNAFNRNSTTYVYAAYASHPFKHARAR